MIWPYPPPSVAVVSLPEFSQCVIWPSCPNLSLDPNHDSKHFSRVRAAKVPAATLPGTTARKPAATPHKAASKGKAKPSPKKQSKPKGSSKPKPAASKKQKKAVHPKPAARKSSKAAPRKATKPKPHASPKTHPSHKQG